MSQTTRAVKAPEWMGHWGLRGLALRASLSSCSLERMQAMQLEQAISRIIEREGEKAFSPGAYHLVREALDFTVARLAEQNEGESRHVSGTELLHGFRDFCLKEYGPMSATLLFDYGVQESVDVGKIVFQLIEEGVFGKQDSDTLEDFRGIYDFPETFTRPFQPEPETGEDEA